MQELNKCPKLTGQNGPSIGAMRAADVSSQNLRGLEMAFRTGRRGELEDARRGDDHRQAVRDERVLLPVALRAIVAHHTADRIGHAVTQVHACIAEADASEAARQMHL